MKKYYIISVAAFLLAAALVYPAFAQMPRTGTSTVDNQVMPDQSQQERLLTEGTQRIMKGIQTLINAQDLSNAAEQTSDNELRQGRVVVGRDLIQQANQLIEEGYAQISQARMMMMNSAEQ